MEKLYKFIAWNRKSKVVHAIKRLAPSGYVTAYCRVLIDGFNLVVVEERKDEHITCQNCIREILKQKIVDVSIEYIDSKRTLKQNY